MQQMMITLQHKMLLLERDKVQRVIKTLHYIHIYILWDRYNVCGFIDPICIEVNPTFTVNLLWVTTII